MLHLLQKNPHLTKQIHNKKMVTKEWPKKKKEKKKDGLISILKTCHGTYLLQEARFNNNHLAIDTK